MRKPMLLACLGLGILVGGCNVHIAPHGHYHRPRTHVVVHGPHVTVGHSHTYTYSHYGYHFGHHTYRYFGHGHGHHHHFGWRHHRPRCR